MMYKLEYTQKRNNMKRLDYILPAIVGIFLFVVSLQLLHGITSFNDGTIFMRLFYGTIIMIFSLLSIFIAINEYKHHNH